ncbi:MAG TPA: PepSY domain-containing protein [Candidatus Nitrosotalea sp.]|nr:PepSY domain-containing protein [Candidatus Nitrosotalea sp.]
MEEKEARDIAENFVRQHFSVMKVETPVLKGGVWHVEVMVSSNDGRSFHLEINARSGRIMGFSRGSP